MIGYRHVLSNQKKCYQFYRANNQGWINFGDIAAGEFANIIFKFKIIVPPNSTFTVDDIIAYQVQVANSGIAIVISSALNLSLNIYNGTGVAKINHDLASYDGQIADIVIKYCQNEASIESNLIGKTFGTYETPQYVNTRFTSIGMLSGFGRVADVIETWDHQVYEADINGNEVSLIADWKLNGNANDDSGNGYNGTLTNWLPENWGSSCE